jgi:hypothetical protein
VSALGSARNLGPPPADPDEEEAPVAEELRRLTFKRVADELEDPADHEKRAGVKPKAMKKETGDEDRDRNNNQGDAERVAGAIHRMLVTCGVLRDPLLVSAIA